jgi:RimJ/RimL family protein N-acetyltransferase
MMSDKKINISIHLAEESTQFQLIESWLSEPRVWKYLGPPFTDGAYKKSAIAFASKSGRNKFYIVHIDDKPVGLVGLSDICNVNKRANCWYVLGDTSFSGLGVIKTACGLVVKKAFEELGLHTLYAWAVSINPASVRILESNGFKPAGRQREGFNFEDKFVDILWFDQLASECI